VAVKTRGDEAELSLNSPAELDESRLKYQHSVQALAQRLHEVDQVAHRASEPVQLVDDQDVVELGAPGELAGCLVGESLLVSVLLPRRHGVHRDADR
jgi:hypothetical protein